MRKTNIILGLATIAALGIAATPQAKADLIYLDQGNTSSPGLTGYTGPFAKVEVNLDNASQATITFTSLTKNGFLYLFGDGGSVGVNVHAASWTLGAITGGNAGTGFGSGQYSDSGTRNEDGFGSFNQTITSFDGYGHSSDTISFTITDTSGTWSSAQDVLTANGSGHLAAAHIFVTTFPANAASNGGNALTTGYATGDVWGPTPPAVPEPATIMAGALLLLPLGATTLRIARKKRMA